MAAEAAAAAQEVHHGHRGTRAVQRMVEYAPSTGGLALWMPHSDAREGDGDAAGPAPIATDGHAVRYRAAFEGLPLLEQTALVANAVLHVALRHPQRLDDLRQRLGDVDAKLFGVCADAIVNSALGHLGWLRLPATAVLLESLLASTLGGTHPPEAALLEWDVERLYLAIDDRREPWPPRSGLRGARSQQGSGSPRDTDDPHGAQGSAPSTPREGARRDAAAGVAQTVPDRADRSDRSNRTDRSDGPRAAAARSLGSHAVTDLLPSPPNSADPQARADAALEWRERLVRAHTGDGAFSMLRTLLADLPRSRTPWEQVLRTQLARALAHKLGVSWSRPSRSYIANQGRSGAGRRMPFEPGLSTTQSVPRLVVVVDVSGSVDDALMARFAREIEAITRRLEAGVTLVIGDDRVQHVQRFEPGRCELRDIAFHGRGGTDFTPLLEEADRHDPDLTVVLTDLQGPARHRPRAPVLWAVPEANGAALQPFGRKVVLA